MKAKKGSKLPYRKMAKAYKEMIFFGFSHDEVRQAVTELMEVYDNNWEFIADEQYRVLMDHMLAKNKEAGEGPSAKPLSMLHPKPAICEIPSKKLRLGQDDEQVPIFADKSTLELATTSTTGIELVEDLTSSSDTEEFEEPSLVRSYSKGFRHRDETSIRADDQCNEDDDLTEACSGSELVKSNPLAIQIKTESRSWEGKSSEMCFMEEEEERPQEQERKTVIHQLDAAGGSQDKSSSVVYSRKNTVNHSLDETSLDMNHDSPMDTPNAEPSGDNLVGDLVPLAVMNPGLSAAFSGQSSGKCSDIKGDGLPFAERGDEQVPNKEHDSFGLSPFDIASSSNGEVKISLLCNSPHLYEVDTTKINAVFKMVEGKFVDSNVVDPSFSVLKLLKEICECYVKTNAGSASASDEQHLSTMKVLSTLDTSEKFILPDNNPNSNALVVIPNNVTNGSLQIPILISLDGLQCISGFNFDEPLDIQALDLRDVGSLRAHVYCEDVTRGEENETIPLITGSSAAEDTPNFFYIPRSLIHDKALVKTSLASIPNEDCCLECHGNCLTSALPCCVCAENSGGFAYTAEGLLEEAFLEKCISTKPSSDIVKLFYCRVCPLGPKPCKGHSVRKFIKECWSKCGCSKKCGNRVVQRGITAKLQVFPTKEGKGWGLQTVDDLPKGAFVCEYVGEIFTDSELHSRNTQSAANQKNKYSVLLDADLESMKDEEALWLDSTNYGNAARFINHRCSEANMIAIPVEMENPGHNYYHVAFFTTRKVDVMEELTWDYGIDFADDEPSFKCLCGSSRCRDMK